MTCYLEYRDAKSEKFWEITVSGSSHTVRYGKVGAKGQRRTKAFDSAEQAQKSAEKLIASKKKKGYTEAAASSAAPVDPAFKTLQLESSVQAAHRAERDARLSDEEVVAFLTGRRPLPDSGEVREQALGRFWELEDPQVVQKAVKHLAGAGLSSRDLMTDLFGGSHPRAGSEAWIEGVALLFAVKVPRDDPFFESWTHELNNTVHRATTCKAPALEAWADIAREYVRDSAYLGHNLACIYVRFGRIEEALQMCQAAAEVGYPQLRSMRTDSDLGPLLQDDRFLALFPAADRLGAGRTQLPGSEQHAAALDEGVGVEAFGQWLSDEGSPLGEVVLADLEAEAEPKKKRKAKNRAKKLWKAYVDSVLAPAYPLIAEHFTHFLEGEYYFSFRYGLLERFDTFQLSTAEEREEALALLADPHARFVRHLAPRGAVLGDLELVRDLRGLQRLNFRWTDITQVTSLEPLSAHRELRALNISNSAVADLEPVAEMPMIQLYARRTRVTDLSCLEGHPTLSNITLDETDVREIAPLLSVPHLCLVGLWDTPLSEQDVAPLEVHIKGAEPLYHEAIMDGIDRWVSHRQVGAED